MKMNAIREDKQGTQADRTQTAPASPQALRPGAPKSQTEPQQVMFVAHGETYTLDWKNLDAHGHDSILQRMAQFRQAQHSGLAEPVEVTAHGQRFRLVHGYLESGRLPRQLSAGTLKALGQDADYFLLPRLNEELTLQPLRNAAEAEADERVCARLSLADALLRAGRDAEADLVFDALDGLDSGGVQRTAHYAAGDDWVALLGRGLALHARGRQDVAQEAIRAAIEQQPDHWRPRAALGQLLAARVSGSSNRQATDDECSEAIGSFNLALALAPKQRRLRVAIAEALIAQKHRKGAAKIVKGLLSDPSGRAEVYWREILVAVQLVDATDVQRDNLFLQVAHKAPPCWFAMVCRIKQNSDPASRLRMLQQAVKDWPDEWGACHELWAEITAQQGLAAGEEVLRQGVARNPDAWVLHNNLRYTYCEWGAWDAALASSTQACNLEPQNREVRLGFAHIGSVMGFGIVGVPAALGVDSMGIAQEYHAAQGERLLESLFGAPRWPHKLPALALDSTS